MPMGGGGVWGHPGVFGSLLPSSALAFASTIHVAIALLRKERGGSATILLASFAFGTAPWLLPTGGGVAVGLVLHLAWFVACERLAPGRMPALVSRRASVAAAPRAPAGFVGVAVLTTFDETPDIRTFRLRRPPGFQFEAGQFLSIRLPVEGKPVVRCYTISSSPGAGEYLEITVKRQGRVSSALHASIAAGSTLEIRGPGGHFRYPASNPRPILLVGGGVGATPLMSILRHAVATEPERPVTLVLSVRTESDIPFRAELDEIDRRHPRARVVIAVTRGADDSRFFPGRIDAKLLQSVAPRLAESECHVCGPLPMIADVTGILSGLGVQPERVHAEAFEAAVAWASPASVPRGGGGLPPEIGDRSGPGGAHEIVFARSAKRITASSSQTLLEAAEEAGIPIEYSCRSGFCGTCRTRLLEGDVHGEPGTLDAAETGDGWMLPCVSFAGGRCVIDA